MVDVKAWLIDKMRKRPRTDEQFKTSTALERLEREGFRPIVKADILENRVKEIRENLNAILQILGGPYSTEEKGVAVDAIHTLLITTASPWLRSMDNPWLAHKINMFLELYGEFRYIPEYLGMLITCACSLINLAMCNIDIEPLVPIIIQTQLQYGGGFGQTLPSSGGRVSETYPSEMVKRPKGGPYPKQLDTDVKEQGEE